MKFEIEASSIQGEALIPASKSHTIRALFFAALADGESTIHNPLNSADAESAKRAVEALGATVKAAYNMWIVNGIAGKVKVDSNVIDVGNSGTTARFLLSLAALGNDEIKIIGDASTSSRPMGPLLSALNSLGATVSSDGGKLPATICGPLIGGEAQVDGATSQYLSSLLAHTPLAQNDSILTLDHLNEKPYVEMTLRWLDQLGIQYEREAYSRFVIKGGQSYPPFEKQIPGDFSSATFFACLGALPGNSMELLGLDMEDPQGDKAIFGYLEKMGTRVDYYNDRIIVTGGRLHGAELDLNDTPDALPAMAALAAHASGVTKLLNVPQARIKETDRIAVMCEELSKMGVRSEELPDGLIIHGGLPAGATVEGHGDHRVVMALAVCASAANGVTVINGAEACSITFPTFAKLFGGCGGSLVVS